MDAVTRLQEMTAKAVQELQEFEAWFKENDEEHDFTGVGCLESTELLAELFNETADSPTAIGVSPSHYSGLSNENRRQMEDDVHKFVASDKFNSATYLIAAQILSAKYRHNSVTQVYLRSCRAEARRDAHDTTVWRRQATAGRNSYHERSESPFPCGRLKVCFLKLHDLVSNLTLVSIIGTHTK